MNIYNYHPVTKEYLSTSTARVDPLEPDRLLIPAFATDTPAPSVGKNEVAVFDDKWIIKKDLRGVVYWLEDRSEHVITRIGEIVPVDGFSKKPPTPEAEIKLHARVAELEAERSASGASKYTLTQLDEYLNARYDPTAFDALVLAIHKLPDEEMSKGARDAIVAMLSEIKKIFGACKEVDRAVAIEVLK